MAELLSRTDVFGGNAARACASIAGMLCARLRRSATWIATAAMLALLWQALMPLAAAMQPRTYGTLCTALGERTVAIVEGQQSGSHTAGDHCALCRIAAAGDLPLPARGWYLARLGWNVYSTDAAEIGPILPYLWRPGSPRGPPAA
jgi:hypothetical protein